MTHFQKCDSYEKIGNNNQNKANRNLRWDHGDIDQYYSSTGQMLYPIYNRVQEMCENLSKFGKDCYSICEIKKQTEYCYKQIVVQVLNTSAQMCIPQLASHVLKPWWSRALSEMKQQSILVHHTWVEAGKPRYGSIFENKNKIKLKYKLEIKRHNYDAQNKISEELHDF